MIKVENIEVHGFKPAIRGLRNPKNSWHFSDSKDKFIDDEFGGSSVFWVGEKDLKLMNKLYKAGIEHRKYDRMCMVWMDITCFQAWWLEFDTYKVGVTKNSCSKMHTIHIKGFEADDFSHEGIDNVNGIAKQTVCQVLYTLEWLRKKFNETNDKKYWRAIIELIPSGYNMKATVCFNYENAINMIRQREHHKLNEWRAFVQILKGLPYMAEIRGEKVMKCGECDFKQDNGECELAGEELCKADEEAATCAMFHYNGEELQ